MTQRYRKLVATIGLAGAIAVAAVPTAMAKHGTDDPPNHNANDNHGRVHDAERVHHHRHHGRHHERHHERGDDRGGDR
jgi:hypothetical protein